MMDRSPFDGFELPPELAELDAELSSIRYEERPSFGPELRAELARSWAEEPRASTGFPRRRQLMAAGVAGLLMVGLGVPSARASLARFVESLRPTQVAEEDLPAAPPTAQGIPALPLVPDQPLVETAPPLARPQMPAVEREAPARYEGPEVTFPELLDREATEEVIRRAYPIRLQQDGVGGVVGLRLWVDSTGAVEAADLGRSSGVPELDRVALDVATSFAFSPARRRGRAVPTPVEFDVRFEARIASPAAPAIPAEPTEATGVPELARTMLAPEWRGPVVSGRPESSDGGDLLRAAVDDDAVLMRLGPIEAILAGDPPAGAAPTRWRSEVGEMLEEAIVRDPDNPAPFLALARIRRKQGLKTEARVLFDRGLMKAVRGGRTSSPTILADLHYERGMLVRESWLATRGSGRVSARALPSGSCPQARSSGGAASGYASADRLIAWNYLCPMDLAQVFEDDFEENGRGSEADRALMMASFDAAVAANPAHVGASVERLLALSEAADWGRVLDGARRFIEATSGHPYGHLLAGLALQRLGRSEEAEEEFAEAEARLSTAEARQLGDVSMLLRGGESEEYLSLGGAERDAWVRRFWGGLDPILSTEVNERAVEHTARSAYAMLRFGSVDSDAGTVWVRYGRPDRIRVLGGGSGVRTEFWDFGPGPDLTFRAVASESVLALTPEGRAYVDEIRSMLPHRYGTAARGVIALPGQVSRFRSQRPGATLFTANVDRGGLPAGFGTGELELNVFLLSSGGTPVRRERPRTLLNDAPIRVEVDAGPEVSEVVIEVRDPATGSIAALRDGAHLRSAESSPGISDLLLVRSARPGPDELRLDADWVQPLAGPVVADAVGVLFELYDAGRDATWFRVRAELEDPATGLVVSVPVRPAGERDFRPTWDRHVSGRGPTPEFLDLLVRDVPAGRYRLRVWADVPGAGAPLVAEQPFQRG